MWMAQWSGCREPRTFITSGGLGAMGFGFPAAMGAKFARPDKQVLALVGDGGFQMTLQDLSTAVEHELSLPIIILNNGALGMVRQWQTFFYRGRLSSFILRNPDFPARGPAVGARSIRRTRPDEVRAAV